MLGSAAITTSIWSSVVLFLPPRFLCFHLLLFELGEPASAHIHTCFPSSSLSSIHSIFFPSPLRRFLPQFLCVHGFVFFSFLLFPIFATVLVCDWPRCVMRQPLPPRPRPCPWTSHMQWVALSGLWVRAAPPQALQPLAGCTGAFPGQVLFITCVSPLHPFRKTPGVVYFFSLVQYDGLPAQTFSRHPTLAEALNALNSN